MKNLWLLAILAFPVLLLSGCGGAKHRPEPLGPPNSRLLHHGDTRVWTFCDAGNRVYQNARGDFQVVPGGCPHGNP